jgi:hypothetical protein
VWRELWELGCRLRAVAGAVAREGRASYAEIGYKYRELRIEMIRVMQTVVATTQAGSRRQNRGVVCCVVTVRWLAGARRRAAPARYTAIDVTFNVCAHLASQYCVAQRDRNTMHESRFGKRVIFIVMSWSIAKTPF